LPLQFAGLRARMPALGVGLLVVGGSGEVGGGRPRQGDDDHPLGPLRIFCSGGARIVGGFLGKFRALGNWRGDVVEKCGRGWEIPLGPGDYSSHFRGAVGIFAMRCCGDLGIWRVLEYGLVWDAVKATTLPGIMLIRRFVFAQ
jgi:hypothetical protein